MKLEIKKYFNIYYWSASALVVIFLAILMQGSFFGMIDELLSGSLVIKGEKSIDTHVQNLEPGVLSNKSSIVLSYDLRGVCLLGGQSSAITLVASDGKRYSVSLSDYGRNCALNNQETKIPLKDFNIDQPLSNISSLETQFWYPTSYVLDIKSIAAYKRSVDFLYSATRKLFALVQLAQITNTFDISRIPPGKTPLPPENPTPTPSTGYNAEYWNTPGQFSKPVFPTSTPDFARNDSAINFVWNAGTPDLKINANHFVARWTKYALLESGTYKFTVTADDGVRVYIDNILIIDQWRDQPSTYYKANRSMTAGVHSIRVEYYENAGGAVIKFDFQKILSPSPVPPPAGGFTPAPSPTPVVVLIPTPTPTPIVPTPTPTPTPQSVGGLTPTPTPTVPSNTATAYYSGEYWNIPGQFSKPIFPTSAPNFTRNDSVINFVWNDSSPSTVLSVDHFVARWIRNVNFDAGTYRFAVTSDDGVRVYLDNEIIIDRWVDQGSLTYSADRVLNAGVHSVKVEYYENAGGAVIKFDFKNISSTVATPTPTPITPTPTPTPVVVLIPTPTPTPVLAIPTPTPIIPTPTPPPTGGSTPTPTPTPAGGFTPTPIPAPNTGASAVWSIRSVSSMKETKDKICGQDSAAFINSWINKAVELGVNYIAVETPYENPLCGNSVAYTKAWVDAIHARGLKVWHRHAPLAFEGIYDTPKNSSINFLTIISDYIKANPTFFREGDIFSPIPEPQNGGIAGITYCPQNICIFPNAASFNKWLRDAITTSETAFNSIGLGGKIKIGYYGFDGFVAWGDNNPDWHGILEDATVQAMGNITIDHYPEIVGDTMENDLNELQAKYPNVPIVIGEWGTITGGDLASQVYTSMEAAIRPNVIGFNYWHMGMGGNEALINNDFTNRANFNPVKSFFSR